VELTHIDDQDPVLGMRPLKSTTRQQVSIAPFSKHLF
jgi:hypothetical protein